MRVRKEPCSGVTVICHKQFIGRKLNGVLRAGFFVIIRAGTEDKGKDVHALQVVGCSKKVDSCGKERILS